MLLPLRCVLLLMHLQLPALQLGFIPSSEQCCATSPRGGHRPYGYMHTSLLRSGSCSACSLLPEEWLHLCAHSPYPHCTVLQSPTDVSAGFGHPSSGCSLCHARPAARRAARSPSSEGAGDANEFAYIELRAGL